MKQIAAEDVPKIAAEDAALRLSVHISRIPQLVRELQLTPVRAGHGLRAPYLFTEREVRLMEGRNRKPGRKGER